MKAVYVVMAQKFSPIAFTSPWPLLAFASRKEAQAFADNKNTRAIQNKYGVIRVPFGGQP